MTLRGDKMNEELREKIKQAITTDIVERYHVGSQVAEQAVEEIMQFELFDLLYLKVIRATHSLACLISDDMETMQNKWYRDMIHKLLHAREVLEDIELDPFRSQ